MEMDGSPAPESQSTGSSGRGTPQISNPGTPRSLVDPDGVRGTPPPSGLNSAAGSPQVQMQTPGTSAAHRPSPLHHQMPPMGVGVAAQHQSKYAQLLAVIEDMGKDIRPTYSGSKTSSERLKRGIVHARILVRECLMECERSARS